MINIPITKILFLDIETVGVCKDWSTCQESNPKIAEQFVKYFDWFLKRFPEDNYETDGLEEELKKIFPDKDIALYMKIVKVNASNYPVQSKVDIHKLYLQFHPDKCNSDIKTVKLCNVFCGKVENIKKCFEFSKNPKVASPIRSRGDDTESVLKILNDEV